MPTSVSSTIMEEGDIASGQNFTTIFCAKSAETAFSGASPGTCTRFVGQGELAHFFISLSSSPANSVTGAKNSLTCLSFSCNTFSYVLKRNEGFPSVSVRTALMAFLRPSRRNIFSAKVNAWAMLVKPFLYSRPSIDDFASRHVTGELLDQQRVGDRAVVHDFAVTELHHTDPHVFVPVVLAHVFVDEASCEILEDLVAVLAEGAAGVDGKPQVLLGNTDL